MASRGRVLVIGGCGFLGHHLVARLLREDTDVRVLDDLSSSSPKRLPPELPPSRFFRGDVADRALLVEALKGVQTVVHLAWKDPGSAADANERLIANLRAEQELLTRAAEAGVSRLLQASSDSVYGSSGAPPFPENRLPSPRTLRGAAKLAAENLARPWAERGDLDVAVLRFFDLYGPGDDRSGERPAMVVFAQEILKGGPPTVFGSGEQTRDYLHVDDAVEAIVRALERRLAAWTVVNVGSGVPTPTRDLAEKVSELLGRPDIEPVSVPEPPGLRPASFADVRLARNLLGFQPRVPLEEGLARRDWIPALPGNEG